MLCSWLLRSSTKNRRSEESEQNTNQRTRDGKPERNTPAGLLSDWICLHAIFSSVRRSIFHVAQNFFRNVERTQENLDRRLWTRGLGENATWLRSHQDFRAGSASHRYRASKIAPPSHKLAPVSLTASASRFGRREVYRSCLPRSIGNRDECASLLSLTLACAAESNSMLIVVSLSGSSGTRSKRNFHRPESNCGIPLSSSCPAFIMF